MKVIFLDIDGVLNPFMYDSQIVIQETFAKNLYKLMNKTTDTKIVLSTFWRDFQSYITYVLGNKSNIKFEDVIDKTCCGTTSSNKSASDLSGYKGRNLQIKKWLQENKKKYNIQGFVILDDRASASDENLKSHFVRTSFASYGEVGLFPTGLNDNKLAEAKKALEIPCVHINPMFGLDCEYSMDDNENDLSPFHVSEPYRSEGLVSQLVQYRGMVNNTTWSLFKQEGRSDELYLSEIIDSNGDLLKQVHILKSKVEDIVSIMKQSPDHVLNIIQSTRESAPGFKFNPQTRMYSNDHDGTLSFDDLTMYVRFVLKKMKLPDEYFSRIIFS